MDIKANDPRLILATARQTLRDQLSDSITLSIYNALKERAEAGKSTPELTIRSIQSAIQVFLTQWYLLNKPEQKEPEINDQRFVDRKSVV